MIDDGPASFLTDLIEGKSIQTIKANSPSRSLLLEVPIESDSSFEANGEITVSIEDAGGNE